MKPFKMIAVIATLFVMGTDAHAGLLSMRSGCGGSKCCDCAPTFAPSCCKPTIVRPCVRPRIKHRCCKPTCCDMGGPSNSCCPVITASPCNSGSCINQGCCVPGNACAAPCRQQTCCDPGCAAPACISGDVTCNAPVTCDNNNCCPGDITCAAPCLGGDSCISSCCDDKANPCCISELIMQSQTACYALTRREALHLLGDHYDCRCHPEIMAAFVFALNDCDHRVRAKAADEIGDQIRKHGCCSQPTVNGLTYALGDPSRSVRRQAEQALKLCGYKIVKPCKGSCCDGCTDIGCCTSIAPAVMPMDAAARPIDGPATHEAGYSPVVAEEAPAPPAEDEAVLFQGELVDDELTAPAKRNLSNLFGLAN